MKNVQNVVTAVSLILFAIACRDSQHKKDEYTGLNLDNMDTATKPSEDFFRYVNGKWLDNVEIPDDRSRWGSFDELRKSTDKDVMDILENAMSYTDLSSSSDRYKAVNMFRSVLDTVGRNKMGIKPVESYLKNIEAVQSLKDVEKLLIDNVAFGSVGFINPYVYSDAKDSDKNVFYIGTGSLGLPDREYYVSDTPDNKQKRRLYVDHIAKMLQLFGEEENKANNDANKVLALEAKMAESMLDRVEKRDRRNTYHPMSVDEAQKLLSNINLRKYILGIGLPDPDKLVVTEPKYMKAIDDIFSQKDVKSWKAYMRWTLIRTVSSFLSTDIEQANWEFYGKTLGGVSEQLPLKERAVNVVNSTVSEALGKLYVEKKFPPEAKTKAEEMISYIRKSYDKRISELSWMDKETKNSALKKLHAIRVKIGYPDKWKDYSKLDIKSIEEGGSYFENMRSFYLWAHQDNIDKYGKPVDKDEWHMPPQMVNAYYNPPNNEIVFPAAILQPPFYDYKADVAVNFGGIGGIIGHEISHGFDDAGARYDAQGNLNNWWTDNDLEEFNKLGEKLVKQYSSVEPLPDMHIDGKFTLGENIADLGGVCVSFEALEMYLRDKGRPDMIDGFSSEQRFFLSWGTIWRSKVRDEYLKKSLKTDPHSPAKYRANIPLMNINAFYKAFDIKEGDKMYLPPEDRVKIW